MKSHNALIMAGGTGGHVFPGLAVALELKSSGWSIDWLGTADRMEATLVPKYQIPIHFIKISGARGKSLVAKLLIPFKLMFALMQSVLVIHKLKPDVVIGMGGYASGPGALAAKLMGVPLVIHEQNAVFGMTNKYLSKIAKLVLTGFDVSEQANTLGIQHKTYFIGNPIRPEFNHIPLKQTTSESAAVNILIVGGSLGALALNQVLPNVLMDLNTQSQICIVHQTGKGKFEAVKEAYKTTQNVKIEEFIDDMPSALEWSDIVICRAGALTVAEVAASGRVGVFVPLPIAVDDHQTKNAESLVIHSAAVIVQQNALAGELSSVLVDLIDNHEKRSSMAETAKNVAKPDATNQAIHLIYQAIGLQHSKRVNKPMEEQK